MNRQQNFHKKAHTARFLGTFHSGRDYATDRANAQAALAEALENGVDGREPQARPTEEEAVAFVTGRPSPKNEGSYTTEISGYKVRCGGGFVSEKQAKWIIDIATNRVLPTGRTAESVLIRLEQGFAKFSGSQFITTYKDLPRATAEMAEAIAPSADEKEIRQYAVAAPKTARPHVADGRYAVEHEGVLKFYRVKNGRKPGYVFLDVQASDDWHSIRNPRRIDEILALIAADELNAARRYGIELGKCSRCGRTLTDETSRAYGIGPDCRSK